MTVDVNGVMKDVEGMGEVVRVAWVGGRTPCAGRESERRGWIDVDAADGNNEKWTGEASKGCVAGGGDDGELRAVTPCQC